MERKYAIKSKLTKEELQSLANNTKDLDPKQSHYRAYRTMMNEIRRELLQYIGCEIRNMDDIKEQFINNLYQLNYHLSMLEQCYFIINSPEGWKSTPLGLAFLDNAKMGDY